MSGWYLGLDYLQIGGHHLALGFRAEEDRDHIHDQRTDRAVHHRLGEAHALVHREIGQQWRNSRTPDRSLVIDEACCSCPDLGRKAFRQPARVEGILAADKADEDQEGS